MKSANITKLTMLLLLLLPSLGCSFATFNNPERSNFASSTTPLNNSLEQTRPRGLYATTKDGRTILLNEGTWEYAASPTATATTATLPNGQRVLLRSDGKWAYFESMPVKHNSAKNKKRPVKPKPPAPAYLHFYQLGGGRGKATVFLNGVAVANLREKRYFIIQVPPGPHVLNIFDSTKGRIAFNTASGMHYFIKNRDTTAWWGEKLILMDVSTGQTEISRLKPLSGADVLRPELFLEPQMASRN